MTNMPSCHLLIYIYKYKVQFIDHFVFMGEGGQWISYCFLSVTLMWERVIGGHFVFIFTGGFNFTFLSLFFFKIIS